ncbi:MAG TPA: 16S rRNA (cytosine(967)-C(5))-methyltransferase RsmB [Candidatus Eisenbacteria bacterium]|nr:16S rRNA (cytosine(967)-C(5))-methyltransferase RsmB [Candidatus Eisenbacteria bacterium]
MNEQRRGGGGPRRGGARRAGPAAGGQNVRNTGQRPNRRRDDRPRDRQGDRPANERGAWNGPRPDAPEFNGQANAINRSRPIYGDARANGARRGRGPAVRIDEQRGRATRGERRPAPAGVEDRSLPPLPANPREAALRILHAADTRSAFTDRLLDGAHQRGGPEARDQALMHELVKGTLRWRGRLDFALDPLVHVGLSQVQPWIKNIMRLGAYQILFLDRIPAHAAVDESVKLAHQYGHPGTAGLVNSVLRRLVEEKDAIQWPAGDDAASLAVWGSHPRWIVERWLARFGPEATRALLVADNRAVPVGLRVNRLRGTRAELIEKLAAEGVTATPATLSPDLVWIEGHHAPGALAAFKQGLCTVQDESEALVARLVAPQPHERVLDLCAAPGGKCTHLAELMDDEGEVWAMERAEPRVASLQANVDRLGTHAVHVVQGDGRSYTFPMPFDRVLVDAPCSGLGVLGRRADARWRKGPEMLRELPPMQLELLAAGGRWLRPGGVLVYSVCSFEPEETTQLVERFLRQHPQFVQESAAGHAPDAVVDEAGFVRLLPHVHGCDGAFAARFRRT